MRGLSKPAPSKTFLFTGGVVAALATAGLVLAGCNSGSDGVRKEGEAQHDAVSRTSASPSTTKPTASPADKVDGVALIKRDPEVDREIRENLKPCVKDEYPVEVSYAELTGAATADVVVNVMTCGDGLGIGSYVYRKAGKDKDYTNVFRSEQAPVFTTIEKNELRVTQQVYDSGDAVCCPSGEDVIHYRWSSGRFIETGRTHTDFSKTVDEDALPSDDGTEG